MHRTAAGDRRQALQKAARAPAARREAERLQSEADAALAEAQALKLQARLEDLTVWQMEKVKQSRKGSKTYTYWMTSWREGNKTRNVHLGSSRKMDASEARQKARERKAEALGAPARRCSSSAS
jgi:predicted acyl esterase